MNSKDVDDNEYGNLILAIEKIIEVLDAASITNYRDNLNNCRLNIKNADKIESSFEELDTLIMSPKALQDIHVSGIPRSEWMSLLANVLQELPK